VRAVGAQAHIPVGSYVLCLICVRVCVCVCVRMSVPMWASRNCGGSWIEINTCLESWSVSCVCVCERECE